MKQLLLVAIVFQTVLCSAVDYKIYGRISGAAGKTVELYSVQGRDRTLVKKAEVKSNEEFEIPFSQDSKPGMFTLSIEEEDQKQIRLFFNNHNVGLETSYPDLVENLLFTESDENIAFVSFYEQYNQMKQKKYALSQLRLNHKTSEEFKIQAQNKIEQVNSNIEEYKKQFFIENKDFFVTAYIKSSIEVELPKTTANLKEFMINHMLDNVDFSDERLMNTNLFTEMSLSYIKARMPLVDRKNQQEGIKQIINDLAKWLDKSVNVRTQIASYLLSIFRDSGMEDVYVHIVEKFIDNDLCLSDNKEKYIKRANQFKRLAIGKPAPQINFEAESGINIGSLDAIKAKRILLLFWATDCPHCKESVPEIYNLYQKYESRGFEVVSTSIGLNKKDFSDLTKNWNWINYYPIKDWESKEAKDFYIYATPTMFYINAENREILAKPLQVYELENLLKKDFSNQ